MPSEPGGNAAVARWEIRFRGRVQHVGFRYTAQYLARDLRLTGWVRNLADGTMLLQAQGGTAQLRQLLIRLKSQPHLHIEKAEIGEIPAPTDETGFRVLSGRL